MQALRLEIERKKRERHGLREEANKKRFITKAELEKHSQNLYHKEQEERDRDRSQRKNDKVKNKYDSCTTSHTALSETASHSPSLTSCMEKKYLSTEEVKLRLRELKQPVQLFGESDGDRLERYNAANTTAPATREEDIDLKRGQMFNESQLYDEHGDAKASTVTDLYMNEPDSDLSDEDDSLPNDELEAPEVIISQYFRGILRLWDGTLKARNEAERSSITWRKEFATYQQCRRHLKPLFRQLKVRTTPVDLLKAFTDIVKHMKQREYVRAHDAYISCAIGNAAWPMGVSVTGLHERQGRQHIRDTKIAHVMNDETQRKYLQSVKRLLTFIQRLKPADGPSQMVS